MGQEKNMSVHKRSKLTHHQLQPQNPPCRQIQKTFNNVKITILCASSPSSSYVAPLGVNLGSSDADAVNQKPHRRDQSDPRRDPIRPPIPDDPETLLSPNANLHPRP
ncbi:hypothetical protein SESBI_02688 [Sesbania bispinosa]|nr:hypothetical protein SESBI_02688 [Sesbania bispinosa]